MQQVVPIVKVISGDFKDINVLNWFGWKVTRKASKLLMKVLVWIIYSFKLLERYLEAEINFHFFSCCPSFFERVQNAIPICRCNTSKIMFRMHIRLKIDAWCSYWNKNLPGIFQVVAVFASFTELHAGSIFVIVSLRDY